MSKTNFPLLPGKYYHIYNRGNNRRMIFFEERNYEYFLRLYAKHINPVAETYAYCLMKNHFHALVRIKSESERRIGSQSEISELKPAWRHFNNFFIAYSKGMNKAYDRSGSMMEKPYRRKLIDSDYYFLKLITYIHLNPQKHQQVTDYRLWPWSSYQEMQLPFRKQLIVAGSEVLEICGGFKAFQAIHALQINQMKETGDPYEDMFH
ncbi:MAG: transposase [Calditrichia bacterium]